jgi:hypothetical protein
MEECFACGTKNLLQKALNEKGERVYLCETCRCCDACGHEEENITESNWRPIQKIIRPAGWIFQSIATFQREDLIMVLCGMCRDLWCSKCKSVNDCKKRCDDCNEPCCNECDCVRTKEQQSDVADKER